MSTTFSPKLQALIDNNAAYEERKKYDPLVDNISMGGYTGWQLHNAFQMVRSPDGWKMPIDTTIDVADIDIVDAAISYYTGGGMEVYDADTPDQVEITAPGYYNMIGS